VTVRTKEIKLCDFRVTTAAVCGCVARAVGSHKVVLFQLGVAAAAKDGRAARAIRPFNINLLDLRITTAAKLCCRAWAIGAHEVDFRCLCISTAAVS
jgi:hypothetical protein